MKKEELRELIAECIVEVMQEQNLDEGFLDALKKQARGFGLMGPHPDSHEAHYDRFNKMHDKRVAHSKKGSYDQFKAKLDAGDKIQKIKTDFEANLKKAMRNAFIEGEAVGMTREEIKKVFNSTILGVMNRYRKLEEEWGKKE